VESQTFLIFSSNMELFRYTYLYATDHIGSFDFPTTVLNQYSYGP